MRRGHVADEDLPVAAGVIQPAERLAVQLPTELAGRGVNRGGERTRGHHVHRARKAELPHHLPTRMQQQREQRIRVVHEGLERRLDPGLSDVRSHASALSDSIIAPRMRPMCRARLGQRHQHQAIAADRADVAALGLQLQKAHGAQARGGASTVGPCGRAPPRARRRRSTECPPARSSRRRFHPPRPPRGSRGRRVDGSAARARPRMVKRSSRPPRAMRSRAARSDRAHVARIRAVPSGRPQRAPSTRRCAGASATVARSVS